MCGLVGILRRDGEPADATYNFRALRSELEREGAVTCASRWWVSSCGHGFYLRGEKPDALASELLACSPVASSTSKVLPPPSRGR